MVTVPAVVMGIGAVAVHVEPGSDPRFDTGTLALSGAIRSFRMVGGNEFAVDWISTAVPEPACAVLAVVAAAGAAISGARRHRHASSGRSDYTCSGTTNGSR
ncbi:hypothetical protein [Posidoniimonas corsicana]|uniref:hypothetical protein n=1 Tax=Posidoniimonas corsicana TaxID=1938618 RepID=UPI0011B52E9B|nr:hypothetical protein [Posidoniimonas corsicana]